MRSGDPRQAGTGPVIARDRVIGALRILRDALREIFDENAYARFLQTTQRAASVESYRDFMRERETGMAKRPRCC